MRNLKAILLMGFLATFTGLFVHFSLNDKRAAREAKIPNLETRANIDEVKKLGSQYCIQYGFENAPIQITEFFSFQCPHCIKLFKNDFELIKRNLIDTGKICLKFHPVPQDLPTAQAMICFQLLDETEKRLFLEAIFEESTPDDSDLMPALMMTAMNVFKKPIPDLNDHDYLQKHPVFEEIYLFLKEDRISAVPTVEVNGQLYAKEIPDYRFIKSFIKD